MARRRVVALVSGGLLALATALVGITGVAFAHTPQASLTCIQGTPNLSISLTSYSHSSTLHNTVSASVDGSSVLPTTNFDTSYANSFSAGSSFLSHTAQVIVHAWDDPTGSHGWTKTINLSAGACRQPTSPPTTKPTPTSPPTATPTAPPTATPTAPPTATATTKTTPTPTATPTATPTETPFESFQGETATPFVSSSPTAAPTETPFESFQGETATPITDPTLPPTSTGGDGSGSNSTPLFALMISLLFGCVGLVTVQAQRRTIRNR